MLCVVTYKLQCCWFCTISPFWVSLPYHWKVAWKCKAQAVKAFALYHIENIVWNLYLSFVWRCYVYHNCVAIVQCCSSCSNYSSYCFITCMVLFRQKLPRLIDSWLENGIQICTKLRQVLVLFALCEYIIIYCYYTISHWNNTAIAAVSF